MLGLSYNYFVKFSSAECFNRVFDIMTCTCGDCIIRVFQQAILFYLETESSAKSYYTLLFRD